MFCKEQMEYLLWFLLRHPPLQVGLAIGNLKAKDLSLLKCSLSPQPQPHLPAQLKVKGKRLCCKQLVAVR